jgi:nicotinate-nucleotide adenylyltransferase
MKIGLYGGTFDPIHFGHLNLAIEIFEAHGLDEVWFCPAQISPHKLHRQPVASEHRVKMLQLAIEDIPQFLITTIELERSGPSYTIDTVRALIEKEKLAASPKQFYLIMGDEAIPGFFNWHQPKEIIKLVPILVGRRALVSPTLEGDSEICAALHQGMTSTSIIEISSQNIRQRLEAEQYCGHLLPVKVLDYIYTHQLYCSLKKDG